LEDIRTWLPDRREQVFACKRAAWREIVRDDRPEYELAIQDGWLLVGREEWQRSDYDSILRSGFGHDFVALGLKGIHLDNVDFRWEHEDFSISANGAGGVIHFDKQGRGRASLVSRQLNEYRSEEQIGINAMFVPGVGLHFEEVVLQVPHMPLEALGIQRVLGTEVTDGSFAGRVVYRGGEPEVLELSGVLADARLEELTVQVVGGPFTGRVDIVLDVVRFCGQQLDTLRFRGRLDGLRIGAVFPLLESSAVDSRVGLDVGECCYEGSRLARFTASGEADDLPLSAVTEALGYGRVNGQLRIRIHSMLVVDDKLRSADVDLIATPPADRPGVIDKALLQRVLQEVFGFDASRFLPDEVEYTKLGAKLLVSGDELAVLGTHGPQNRTILTIRVAGREWGLVKQPDRTYPVGDLVAMVRERLQQYDTKSLEAWWRDLHATPDLNDD
jgi:hypothetical protein